jgi:hypothetical protein
MTRQGFTVSYAKQCEQSQVPKGLAVSTGDQVQPVQNNMCIASISQNLGVPVQLPTN